MLACMQTATMCGFINDFVFLKEKDDCNFRLQTGFVKVSGVKLFIQ